MGIRRLKVNTRIIALLIKFAPALFYTVLVIFLVFYLQRIDYSKFSNITIDWQILLLASIFGIAVRYWGSFVWISLLKSMSLKKIDNQSVLYNVYAKSWLARYIPGTAAWLISKVYFASRLGISKNKLAVSTMLEAGLQFTIVVAFSVLLLALDPRSHVIGAASQALLFATLLGCLLILIPPVFNRVIGILYKIIKRKKFSSDHYVTNRLVVRGALLYLIWSLLGGLGLFFVAKSLYPNLGIEDAIYIMGASNLAGALSMLAFFAPSGIGVREGLQVAMLSIIMPTEIALAIALFTRLWSVIIDFIFFGITWAVRRLIVPS